MLLPSLGAASYSWIRIAFGVVRAYKNLSFKDNRCMSDHASHSYHFQPFMLLQRGNLLPGRLRWIPKHLGNMGGVYRVASS
jgi:hypothetical protein